MKNEKKRNLYAISAQFRTSAGSMKDKKRDKKTNRREARKAEKNQERPSEFSFISKAWVII